MTEPLVQLIYASAATRPFSAVQLEQLLTTARRNNAARAISGMLIYHEGSFIQVLEGPAATVQHLFERIDRDSRHREMRLLLRNDGAEREFGHWSMGFVQPTHGSVALPGFVDYESGLRAALDGGETARKVLRAFRDGNWRRGEQRERPVRVMHG
ncbi:MAG: BLUF domain-containing protein [Geminicoccaceae bacterium]|nr:BLUF domain-containing protein [Geminicoccaceae bacterium]